MSKWLEETTRRHLRVRNHAVLLLTLTITLTLTLTFDLPLPFEPKTIPLVYRISQGHCLHHVWTVWDHSFFSYAVYNDVKMHLLTLWPWALTFEPQNHTTSRISQGHSLYQVLTLCGLSFLSYAADKQTNRQTDRQTNKRLRTACPRWPIQRRDG